MRVDRRVCGITLPSSGQRSWGWGLPWNEIAAGERLRCKGAAGTSPYEVQLLQPSTRRGVY